MIVTRPYNSETGQTFGAVTSVPHPWHGINNAPGAFDEAHTIIVQEPPSASDSHSSGGTQAGTPQLGDPEQGADTMDSGRRELNSVIGEQSFKSALDMPPATESSDGIASDVEKAPVAERSAIN